MRRNRFFATKERFIGAVKEASRRRYRNNVSGMALSQISVLVLSMLLLAMVSYQNARATMVWDPEQEISTDAGTEWQQYPSIAAEGGKVHVVWIDEGDGDRDIYYRYFDGIGWQPEQEISTDIIGMEWQYYPSIAAEGGKVHVVWDDWGDGDLDIYYRYFNGTIWQSQQEISRDAGTEDQLWPSIAADAGKVHVVWVDEGDGDRDIHYRRGVMDTTSPESNADQISPYWQTTSTFDIEWTATDDLELANISLYYRYSSDNSSWSIWEEWDYDDTISGTSASGTFSFVAPYGEGFYEFYTIANDTSGNSETAPATADAIVGLDTTPPTGSITINNGDAWTNSTSVMLTSTYSDGLSGVSQVRYSNDGTFDTEPWESPTASKAWTLISGDGTKTVWYQIMDNASNTYTVSDDIGLDTAQPTGSVIINSDDQWANSISVTLTLTYSDAVSGVSQVRYSNDGVWDTEPWESSSATKVWMLETGDGTKTVYFQIRDNAGMESITCSDDIGLDETAPTIESVTPLDGATDVEITTNVVVTFSERMNQSATEDSISLWKDTTETEGNITWTTDGKTLFFTPAEDLEEGTDYQVVITTTAKDLAGNSLVITTEISFTTEKPEQPSFMEQYWWVIVPLIVIIAIIIILMVARMRRRLPVEEEVPVEEETVLETSEEAE